ncbi:MAG: threonine ammonia-lyase [Alphaproteobacteria bacterium 64-11]|nr:threonine ammonia-lyase [Alphaproteobacteria bacterium]OJU12386.1 MAG: threonine ammonia-lyase [Alphaproteobacteria bacterium 64-11]
MTALPVTFDDVKAAARAVGGALVRTPTRRSLTLSRIAGCEVWLKFENRQFTASFKERGALNRLLALTPDEKKRGVAAMSAGNHAQGVAYHAGRLGIPATIVMPLATPFTKVKHTRDFGARVILQGHDLIEANAAARALADAEGLTFIHPYDDARVIAGQGTAALEMLEDVPDLDMLVVPVGGGGLISGCAVAAKAMRPAIDIYGVQTELYPAMAQLFHGGTITASPPLQTIAEGIAVKAPGVMTTAICRALVSDILLVSEAAIEHALAMLLEIEKTVVEGAAAAGFAALLANPSLFAGRKVGVVLSGGNIDMRLLSNVILRELAREGRIMTLELEIEDRPGLLAQVSSIVGEAGGNILEVSHNRMMTGISAKSTTLGMVVESRDAEHGQEIRDRLAARGFIHMGAVNGR